MQGLRMELYGNERRCKLQSFAGRPCRWPFVVEEKQRGNHAGWCGPHLSNDGLQLHTRSVFIWCVCVCICCVYVFKCMCLCEREERTRLMNTEGVTVSECNCI